MHEAGNNKANPFSLVDLTDGTQMSTMKRGGNSGSFSTLNSGEFPSQSPFQRNVRATRVC